MKYGIDIKSELAKKTFLAARTPSTTPDEEARTFAELGKYRDGAIYVGAFAGVSCWERHASGDEIVQVLEGSLELTIVDGTTHTLHLRAGMLAVVQSGRWHRLFAPDGVTLLTVTPLPTETSIERREGSDRTGREG